MNLYCNFIGRRAESGGGGQNISDSEPLAVLIHTIHLGGSVNTGFGSRESEGNLTSGWFLSELSEYARVDRLLRSW